MMIGQRIKELRGSQSLTQREFAQLFNVNNSTLAMWETNKNEPDIETIKRLAQFFDVSTDYLLGLTDEWGNAQPSSGSSSAGTTKPPSELSEDEQELLDIYVSLTLERRRDVLTLVKSLATADAWQNKKHA